MGDALIRLDDGSTIFAHGEGLETCSRCGFMSQFLCDWPMGRGKTCDLMLCEEHAFMAGPEQHYCPTHADAYRAMIEEAKKIGAAP